MDRSTRQRYAAAALIGECESIVESGLLNEDQELSLRILIADALTAFNMPLREKRHEDRGDTSSNRIEGGMDS